MTRPGRGKPLDGEPSPNVEKLLPRQDAAFGPQSAAASSLDAVARWCFAHEASFGNRVPIEAICARVLVYLWRRERHGLTPERRSLHTLCRIAAQHEWIDTWRRSRRRREVDLGSAAGDARSPVDDPSICADRSESIRRMRLAVARLPVAQRRVAEMFLEGYALKDIAERLGDRPGTVRMRFGRAIRSLAALLADDPH